MKGRRLRAAPDAPVPPWRIGLLPFHRVAAERCVLMPDLQRVLILRALEPLLHRVHALPNLDCHPLRRRAFNRVNWLRSRPSRTADGKEASAGVSDARLSLGGELR